MTSSVNQSQFYMWRTLFAVAHADNVVTKEEVEFMAHILEDIDFSEEQTEILKDDIMNAKNVEEMFKGITAQEDRTRFFDFARDLVWVDGDFGSEEQGVMIKLYRQHFNDIDVDQLIGKVSLQFEDDFDAGDRNIEQKPIVPKKQDLNHTLHSFRRRFLEILGGGKD